MVRDVADIYKQYKCARKERTGSLTSHDAVANDGAALFYLSQKDGAILGASVIPIELLILSGGRMGP